MKLSPLQIQSFQTTVYNYFKIHERQLPWRQTSDAYQILVSEVMLQQTQVSRVLIKYPEWLHKFSTISSLASASLAEVLEAWTGLGYNRRAKYLHDFAVEVMSKFNGRIPSDQKVLKSLPGIGSYTSASLLVFAYNQPLPLIETNIRTAIIHHFLPDQKKVSDSAILPLVNQTMDKTNPRKWFNAMMDYGTYLKASTGNLNQRSSTYSKQGKFDGSIRQVRGQIMKILTANPHEYSLDELVNLTGFTDEQVNQATKGLVKDGMICYHTGKIELE